jgi:hypothetical protein
MLVGNGTSVTALKQLNKTGFEMTDVMNYLATLVTFSGPGLSSVVFHRPLSWVVSFTLMFVSNYIATLLVRLMLGSSKPMTLSRTLWFSGVVAACFTLYVAYTGNQADRLTYDEIPFLVAGMLSYELLHNRMLRRSASKM